MTIKKEIIYPIFLECCQHAQDNFWENIFEDLAYGKTPYGTYISKNFLCCNYKKKEFNYKIEKKDSQQIYQEIYKIFTNKLGILSQQEKASRKKIFNETEEQLKDNRKEWGDIRKKNLKELLIELYVTRMKSKHNLTLKQTRYIYAIIMMALAIKIIDSSDIEYKNGKIVNIQGIEFSKRKVTVNRNLYNLNTNTTNGNKKEVRKISDVWFKYLKELNKTDINT